MEYFIERVNEDEDNHLEHHGILGMKWGVRRYQNKDGSLTEKGQTHRTLREKIHDYKVTKKRAANLKKARLARQAKKEEEEKRAIEAEKRKEAIKKGQINYKDMTDEELYNRINRLSNEKRLKSLEDELVALNMPKKKESKIKELGKKAFNDAVVPALTNAGKAYIEKKAKDLLGLNTKEAKTEYQKLKEEAEMSKWRKQILDDKHDVIGIKKKLAAAKEEEKAAAEFEKRKANAQKEVDDYNDRWQRGEADDRVTPSSVNAAGRRDTVKPRLLGDTHAERAYGDIIGEGTSRYTGSKDGPTVDVWEGNGFRSVYSSPVTSVSTEVRNSGYERTTKLLEGPIGSTSLSVINKKK